ncbi:MAG: excinuclease ABC subunit C, partial [Methanocorpusculaceae archaeon]|nr:excinuclease ABC subunit C [Methanocorpusculaceae archaeon]
AKKKLVELAGKNIETVHFGDDIKVHELQNALHLKNPPNVIECFDISHLSGTDTVASMGQFRHGKPDKRNYRRFKIKTVDGIDDFASMSEVVRRRYTRLLDEDRELPDLILIDGGKGQLSSAKRVLDDLEIETPVISLAEREEEVFVSGVPFPLPFDKKTRANMYLQEIRDEAHRFAIEYNRLLRRKRALK